RAGRLGECLVVTDHHAEPADRSIEGGERVTGSVAGVLPQRLMYLAVQAEYTVAADTHHTVVPDPSGVLAEPGTDHDVPVERGQPGDLRPVGTQRRWRLRTATQVRQITAQARLGQGEQPYPLCPRRCDQLSDPLEVRRQVAVERRRHRSHPQHVQALPSPVT